MILLILLLIKLEPSIQQGLTPVTSLLSNCSFITPNCPNEHIYFYLYTSPDSKWKLDMYDMSTIQDAPFIKDAPLKVLIHGYTGHADYAPNPELKKAYFQRKKPINIISIDWGYYALSPCYYPATSSVPTVGNCTAQMLLEVYKYHPSFSQENTHVFGFSLGAHVAGHTGKFMKELSGQLFTRLTAADPALPLYDDYTASASSMVNSNDAQFVDVIHTNAGYKGKVSSLGHVDFFMNSGGYQPGCHQNSSCDHVRAVEYYAESINNPFGFIGKSCTIQYSLYMAGLSNLCADDDSGSTAVFGEYVTPETSGNYHVVTNSKPPYATGS